ncbi:MAG: GNAT family N-acetyltransferase [Huintestinicola sp.]
MNEALRLAAKAAEMGEVPVGAVVVRDRDGLIVGRGYNRRESLRSPLAHAELEALDEASRCLGGWRLSGCSLYVTLEPCPMCAGGIINSRIDRVVFGAFDSKAGSCGSLVDLFSLGYNHHPRVTGGFMEAECSALLKSFFKEMRSRKMNGINLIHAETEDQLRRIAEMADQIWHEFFPGIISEGQIDYMVEKFCSFDAMRDNIANDGYMYYIISRNGQAVGYTATKKENDGRLFLSKIYLYKEHRGKGYARKVMEIHKDFCRNNGLNGIWLTVNKHNDNSIAVYKALGFKIIGEGVSDIGNGYVMDDYYLQLDIENLST